MKVEGIDIDKFFPYQKDGKASYRPFQKEAIEKALRALIENDYDLFFIDAPVGYGKSSVNVALTRIFDALGMTSYLTTPQLILQDQYNKEFPEIPMIKGRSNYVCVDDVSVSCADAECQVDESYQCPMKENCTYVKNRDKCIEAPICQMNTSYLMTVRRELFDKRDIIVCDEAHGLPEAGVGFVSVTIRESDVGLIPVFDKGFPAYLVWLEKMIYPKFKTREDELKETVKGFGKVKRKAMIGVVEEYKRVRDIVKKIENLSSDFSEYEEEWIVDVVEDTKGKKIVFQPITSGRFLDRILWSRGSKVILSSGTIEPWYFIKEGGLDKFKFNKDACVISVPSEFPKEKSPIYYKPIGKMTKSLKQAVFPLIMREINAVLRDRTDRKSIVHCFSYDNADYIVRNIAPELKSMMFVQDRFNRSGSLESWMNNEKPSIFVSTNMSEGLNLKDESCRCQIYVKIGFPNISDKRVAKRLELGHWLWYNFQAIEDIEQASGRATRSKEDWSEMFIYDASFGGLFVKYNKFIKKWFKDRMVFVKV